MDPLNLQTPRRFLPDPVPRWMRLGGYGLALAALSALMARFTALPITWDELLYMGLAWAPEKDPRVLNRYAHIYLLQFFMWIFRDPYLGARLLWCVSVAGSVLALAAATAPLRPPLRAFVLLTASFLLAGQETLVWTIGLAYVDHTLMLAMSLSLALVYAPIFRSAEISRWSALALGLLFLFGFRSKELGLALAALPLLFFVSSVGELRISVGALGRVGLWLIGAIMAQAILMGLDAWMLHDPWFSIRKESWQALYDFNTVTGFSSPFSWFTWLVRPENFTTSVLYVGLLVPLAACERNLRLTWVFLLPLFLLVLLLANFVNGMSFVVPRYVVPVGPATCLFAATSAGLLLEHFAASRRSATIGLHCGSGLAALGLASVIFLRGPLTPYVATTTTFLHEVVLPATLIVGTIVLTLVLSGFPRLRMPIFLAALAAAAATNLNPAFRVASSLTARDVRGVGKSRFHDIYQTCNAVRAQAPVRPRLLVAGNIYNSEFLDRGEFFIRTVFGMSLHVRISPEQLTVVPDLGAVPNEELVKYDFVVGTPEVTSALAARLSGGRLIEGSMRQISVLYKPGVRGDG